MPESAPSPSSAAPAGAVPRQASEGGRATYWLETLGCPKNQVDSEKLGGRLESEGYRRARRPEDADLLVVNTCAFIDAAREESIEAVLELAGARKKGAQLTVTGCLAERYGEELAEAMPEVDTVAGFGVALHAGEPAQVASAGKIGTPVRLTATRGRRAPSFDLLNLPRPPARAPWAYVKVAEGCDRRCGFCAIPSFRGPQRSRSAGDILDEVDQLGVEEVVLVAQDLVSWDRDLTARARRPGTGRAGKGAPEGARELKGVELRGLADLVRTVRNRVERVRLLYLYPSGLTDELIGVIGDSGCAYYDLSLQHVSAPLLRAMRRPGDAERFLQKISAIRRRFPEAALRSSFIVGYPGETEEDHDALLHFLEGAQLDWVGFFAFSLEEGTYAAGLPGRVPPELVAERLRECSAVQDPITSGKRAALVGTRCRALVDRPGQARGHREAPEIDGVVRVPRNLAVGSWVEVEIVESVGPDLVARPVVAGGHAGGTASRSRAASPSRTDDETRPRAEVGATSFGSQGFGS